MIVRCHLKRGPIVFKAEILWEYNIWGTLKHSWLRKSWDTVT
jgi:hypothetical protein